MKHFGEKQTDIAKLLKVSKSTVSEYCKGKQMPRMDKIEMLALHFGVLKSELLEDHTANIKNNAETSAPALSEDAQKLYALIQQLDPEQQALLLSIAKNFLQGQSNM